MSENRNDNFYLDLTKPEPETPAERVILLPSTLAGARPQSEPEAEARQDKQTPPPLRPLEPKRRRRGSGQKILVGGVSRWAVALLLVFGVLLSSALGFAGGLVADSLNQPQQPALAQAGPVSNGQSASMSALYAAARGENQALTPAQVAGIAADAVVEIVTETEVQVPNFGFWGWGGGSGSSTQIVPGAGSGVILSADGYIITNNHVINKAQKIQITLRNGQSYEAELVATDAATDVAVLKIAATGLSAATLGDSDALVVGEQAVVIGNPLGQLGGTVTSGVISALDRPISFQEDDNTIKTMNLLQTDAAINSGNSGGGLFNQYGQLVGIVVAKSGGISVEGLGFAIPINDVRGVIDDLISYGYARGRIALGVQLLTIDSEQAMNYYRVEKMGVYIYRVEQGSNAERAGLQPGDLLVSLNGASLSGGDQVKEHIQALSVGDTLSVVYERDGVTATVQVEMRETVPAEAAGKTTS